MKISTNFILFIASLILSIHQPTPTQAYNGRMDHDHDLPILKGKVVSGIYIEETSPSNQFVLYEKVVPLIFEFRLRSDLWSSLPVGLNKFKLLPRLNCRSDNKSTMLLTSDWLFTCPIFYHVNEFLKQFKANYTDFHPLFRPGLRQPLNNAQEYQKFSHHPSIQFECDQIIARSWKGIYGRDMGLSEYRILLEKCNTLPTYFEDQITDYSGGTGGSSGINTTNYSPFDSIKDNFMTQFFLNASIPSPDPGSMINNLLATQVLHLINTFAEITRLKEALLSCQTQVIPYSFIKTGRLEKALQEIKIKLISQKYTIPTGLTISKLLKLPITDCIFGPNTMIVQILVPVIRTDNNFSLLKFTYPTFLYKDQMCGLKSVKELPREAQPQFFHFDRGSKTLLENKCDKELCHLPDSSERPLLNQCIFELLNASFEAIRVKQFCTLHCEKLYPEYSKRVLPLIQRVSPTRFVIAVNRISSILIKCEGKPDQMITPQNYGAVEVTLPCGNCYLMYHDEKFHSRAPCGGNLLVQHVIPEHMVNTSWNQEQEGGGGNKFVLVEPSTKVNFSLFSDNDSVSLLDLQSENSASENLQAFSSKNGNNDQVGTSIDCYTGHIYLWVFLIIQTIFMLIIISFLLFKLNSLSKQCEYGRSAVSFSVSQMTNLDENK